ncbi:alpha/beta hydrolase [Microterricola viridarii]|uniref:alpha/beta fold hydrolase n=1 Tax=Microterricola viridarii TaxID=412690 RepID=UPI002FFBB010
MGGMIAQGLVVKHPELVRKLILAGTGPRGGAGIDKVAGTTYRDTLRAGPIRRSFTSSLAERKAGRQRPHGRMSRGTSGPRSTDSAQS